MAARTILHVDMDAFYAAVEQRDRPSLMGQPVIIGADPRGGAGRGVVSTASYEARRFGVRSAMPISQAYRLCPLGHYVAPDMEKYSRVSEQVMAIVRSLTDRVEPVSIDEAFVDVSDAGRILGSGESAARRLKEEIRHATALTASVGVATSKLVAKVASDMRKPDGLVVVPPGTEAAFLAPLPVRRLWGVGPRMEERLLKAGVQTIGDLAALSPAALDRRFGTHGHDLQLLARGIDDRPVLTDPGEAKSVGHEHTYDTDTADVDRLRRTLLDLADGVARRLRHLGLRGRTVTLKYRDETFRTVTRASTLSAATDAGDILFQTAWQLFGQVHGRRRVRLLGIYASSLGAGSRGHLEQIGLFAPLPSAADRLRDVVAEKFGREALTRASLLGRRERRHPEALGETGGSGGSGETRTSLRKRRS